MLSKAVNWWDILRSIIRSAIPIKIQNVERLAPNDFQQQIQFLGNFLLIF